MQQDWFAALSFLIGSIVIGLLVQVILIGRLRAIAGRTKWEGDEIVFKSFRKVPFLWCLLGGSYGALQLTPFVLTSNARLIEKILLILFILSATVVAARAVAALVNLRSRRQAAAFPAVTIFANISRIVVYILGMLTICQSLGISITPALTALGVGGLAVALALQDTLSNMFSGLQIIASGQLAQGDYVRLDSGEEGYISDVMWRTTTIKTLANNMVIVPNSKLASAIITNFHQPTKAVAITVNVNVGYENDLERVEAVTLEVARSLVKDLSGDASDMDPAVRFQAFGDSSIAMNVILRATDQTELALVRHTFIKRLHARFEKEGMKIPYPVRMVHAIS